MPRRTQIPNPLRPRLSFVKQTYEERPEVYRRVTDIVKEAAGLTEIGERDRRPWEKQIGKLATVIGKADKKLRKGQMSRAEFDEAADRAREDFLRLARVEDEAESGRQRKGRETIARRKERLETLAAKTSEGHKIVAPKLVGGYIGVEATPNRDAPKFPSGLEAQKRWVAENAPYQQWLGVQMGNCLQFYRVNYVAYGAKHFETQRNGGTLYAVLSKDGKPVAAVLATKDGRIVDANGPGNRSPSGLAQRAMLQLIKKMGLKFGEHQGRGGNQLGIERADARLERLFEYFVDDWPVRDLDTRDLWMQRIRLAASQNGFEFEPALRKFLVYILVGSKKYSVLTSVKKGDYPRKREVEKILVRVARLIQKKASGHELRAARRAACEYGASAGGDAGAAANAAAAANARSAANAATAAANADSNDDRNAGAHGAAYNASWAAYGAADADASSDDRDVAREAAGFAARRAARQDYAAALLYFVEQQAQAPRRRRQQNPSTEKVPTLKQLLGRTPKANPRGKPAKKKTTRKPKAGSAAGLKSECRRLWEHYCERPNKTRLKAVIKHCDLMAESSAKSVKQERARCLRSAKSEAKMLGLKL